MLDFENYRAAIENGDWPNFEILAGIVFQSKADENQNFQYKIRWGAKNEFLDMEVHTNELFAQSIIPFLTNFESCDGRVTRSDTRQCVEQKYMLFTMFQSMVDEAFIRKITDDKSFLPKTTQELCSKEMVSWKPYLTSNSYIMW